MTTGDTPLHVVPEEVKAVGRFAYDVAEQLRSGSMSLDREVQALFGTWKGSAADGYRAGWDDVQDRRAESVRRTHRRGGKARCHLSGVPRAETPSPLQPPRHLRRRPSTTIPHRRKTPTCAGRISWALRVVVHQGLSEEASGSLSVVAFRSRPPWRCHRPRAGCRSLRPAARKSPGQRFADAPDLLLACRFTTCRCISVPNVTGLW
ncbi:WXG100 family type VII secretion target [Nocardia sputi]|uniref:WXG100 family type VII secretion target n=1 Tax=Nocardia sputi TaxID=2943705 RepID=UPI0020BD7F61|nr:WXG100 family type VII secretion target [Nocardia sputi]